MYEHLKDLLENTPSSQAKFLAAWDGLSVGTQIKLLHAVADGGRLHLSFHRDIVARALKSPNEYIRYLAARSRDVDKDTEVISKIAADESTLVRYAQEEVKNHQAGYMEFLNAPKAKQLAIARSEAPPRCSGFAKFLMQSVNTRTATDDELSDVVLEYLRNPNIKKCAWQHEDLWKIVPQMPEGVACKLLDNLVAEHDHSVVIPSSVLDWLSGDLLTWLLCRNDVCLEEFRKRIFLSNEEKYTAANRIAAASINFAPTFEEFHQMLKEQSARLEMLACLGDQPLSSIMFLRPGPLPLDNLRLVFIDCLKDYFASRCEKKKADNEASGAFQRRLARFEGKPTGELRYPDRNEIRELKIYRLAKLVMSWEGVRSEVKLCEPLKFLRERIVQGDTWETFIGFHCALSLRYDSRSEKYVDDRYLPVLREIETEESESHEKTVQIDPLKVDTSVKAAVPDWLNWTVNILRRLIR